MTDTTIYENSKENFNQKRERKTKLVTQITLRMINPEAYKDLSNFAFFLENLSPKNRELVHFFWEADKRKRSGFLTDIFYSREFIAKKVDCSTKTVDRYNKDCHSLVAHNRRTKHGKQTSNTYQLNNHTRKWLRVCDRIGLFKKRHDSHAFKKSLRFLLFLHSKFGSNFELIMNAINRCKGAINQGLKDCFEQAKIKMSLGDPLKCPSSSYLSNSYPRICTSPVHLKGWNDFKRWIEGKMKQSLDDLEWFLGQEKRCYNTFGFLKSRFTDHSRQKTF